MSRYPKKLFYKIGEVCEICGVEAHVLRYWESEFSALAPTRNRSGQRIYRQKDLHVIDTIKRLLYKEGYTIAGAGRQLLEQGVDTEPELPLLKKRNHASRDEILAEIRQNAQAILDILDRRAPTDGGRKTQPLPPQPPRPEPTARPPSPPVGTQLVIPEVLLGDASPPREASQDEPASNPDLKLAES
jgi:DNA-binding transcriptional MerR regulator